MQTRVTRVEYQNQSEVTPIERISKPSELREGQVEAILRLLRNAYTSKYERPYGSVPQGSFAAAFNPRNADLVRSKGRQMHDDIENGAVYWFIPSFESRRHWVGLAKTMPSRATAQQKEGAVSPNCYLADIVVDPLHQLKHRASMLLETALAYGGFEQQRALALDGFIENVAACNWMRRLGLVEAEGELPLWEAGEAQLQQIRLTTPSGYGIGDVRRQLAVSLQLEHINP